MDRFQVCRLIGSSREQRATPRYTDTHMEREKKQMLCSKLRTLSFLLAAARSKYVLLHGECLQMGTLNFDTHAYTSFTVFVYFIFECFHYYTQKSHQTCSAFSAV